ncbi:glycosyltransferase family 2 protein [Ruegeria conchae]|uniref:Glycosyl transferase family 2 n=1 Tax=Ruegeria conchae TaxID=981384 RepID=A0A497ZF53_9RHOB|nr:glycosyltransferase [Ruegeria conchae]RLK07349.1 glycosyl transferase family 2 [Ruegeria conchae]
MFEISVIIPANNEEAYIGPCLEALLAQVIAHRAEVIVSANACTDKTADIARSYAQRFEQRDWHLEVLDSEEGGKPAALNRADAVATGGTRVYLDADVVMSPMLLDALVKVLDRTEPAYASGDLKVSSAQSWVTRAYGRIWTRLPFMTEGVPGAGLFAVNAAGRARWEAFPQIISDDTFVRLQFTPDERLPVSPPYSWPLVEGFQALVRVRRRQDAGVAELARLYPGILDREGKAPLKAGHLLRLALTDPIGFGVYVAVSLSVRSRSDSAWSRGR